MLPILSDDACNFKYQLIDKKKGFCAGVQGDNKGNNLKKYKLKSLNKKFLNILYKFLNKI